MIKRSLSLLLLVVLPACGSSNSDSQEEAIDATPAAIENPAPIETAYWPDWRGPSADGHSEATGLPQNWSETENILWKTPIHDVGHSTPVIWGDQIWLTTATKDGNSRYALCINLTNGDIVHDIELFRPEKQQRNHVRNSFATPSPVIEDGKVYLHFGTYGTVCLDTRTGEKIWSRNDLKSNHFQGPVSSPILFENLLILNFQGFRSQYIVALNKDTGQTIWRKDRPPEIYSSLPRGSFPQSYETPVVVEVDGAMQLVSNSSKVATGADPRTGEEIWRIVYDADNTVSRIVTGHGLFFINHGVESGKSVLSAVRQGGTGDITDSHVAWRNSKDRPLLSSPVLVEDLLYSVSDQGILTCLEAKSGEEVWSERLSGKFGPSLLYADSRIYLSNQSGTTTVFAPGRSYQELAVNKLDGSISASPIVAGDSLLLRTNTHLYRIKSN